MLIYPYPYLSHGIIRCKLADWIGAKVRVWVNKECQIKSGVKEENFESELFEGKEGCRWWGVRKLGRVS
jgi:hypothetical protein